MAKKNDDSRVSPFRLERSSVTFGDLTPGHYPARLTGVIYLGTQVVRYPNRTVEERQFYILMEVIDPLRMGPKGSPPILTAQIISANSGLRSKLSALAKAIQGASYSDTADLDVANLLGGLLYVKVERNEEGYNRIAGLGVGSAKSLAEKFRVDPFIFDPISETQSRPWQEVYEELNANPNLPTVYGHKVADIVAQSVELSGSIPRPGLNDDGTGGEDDVIPF